MKITFDTNVWQKILIPNDYLTDPFVKKYEKINSAIENKIIIPFISETIFTIEAINKEDRLDFLRSDKSNIKIKNIGTSNGSIKLDISIAPNPEIHPGNNSFLEKYLEKALELGFNILVLPRLAGITNPQMKGPYFQMSQNELNKMDEVANKIKNHRAGVFHAMEIGFKYDNSAWYAGLGKAPENEWKKIVEALAEWADGDSVAAHIGINGDYFCTNDMAGSSGITSVLSSQNKKWLKEEYLFKTISPADLADIL